MFGLDDTIVAVSTPLGEGGIGIVRMTGPQAVRILLRLFMPGASPSRTAPESTPSAGTGPGEWPAGDTGPDLMPRMLRYGHIVEPATGEAVDEVLVVYMPAPHTYTRQDVVEINGHGGFVALQRIQTLCLRMGARLAERGEFTARAFLNGRLDLAQAEAVLDLVRARTDASLQAAVGQLAGRLSNEVRLVRSTLVAVLAWLEASIDFPEDEIPAREIGPNLAQAGACLTRLLADADRGILYRQGLRAAIIGRPNVGKSSLLNQLLRTSRAIVTDIPGTTRDTVEEALNLEGIPIVLIDTAGIISKPEDPLERLGIERSRAALALADLALLVVDASQPLTEADRQIGTLVGSKPAIVVLNKADLLDGGQQADEHLLDAPHVAVSALTGAGLEALEAEIVRTVFSGQVTAAEAPMVTSPRHKEALHRALEHVAAAQAAQRAGQLDDLIAIDVTAAISALGEITGQTASDDLLEAIFADFCVGK